MARLVLLLMPHRAYRALSVCISRFRANVLAPDRQRNPWARLACRLLGIALLGVLLVIGMLLYSILSILVLAYRLLGRQSSTPSAKGQIMDGQYRVVDPKNEPPVARKEF